MAKDKNQERMSALDKINLAFGLLAILMLGGAILAGYLPEAARPQAGLIKALQFGGYGAMALYVLTLAALKKDELLGAAKNKHAASGANSTVQIVAVLAILTAVNWWGTRYHMRFDVTENKQFSLAEQSKKVVTDLKEPVNVAVFVKKDDPYSTNLTTLWKQYAYHGGDNLQLEVIDVDREPHRARAENVTTYGTSVLKRGDRKTTITAGQEQDLTSALIKVSQNDQKVVYFLTGHGEMPLDKFDRDGLSYAKDAIEKQNYKVDTLSLFGANDVPSDAALVVVAGPDKPLLADEKADLESYLAKGGRVFLALRPQVDVKLDDLTEKYGIKVRNDLVLDPQGLQGTGNLAAPVVQKFPFHAITQNLQAAFFVGSRSLERLEPLPQDVHVTPLVETSEQAWGETNLADRRVAFNEGQDRKGPLPLVLLGEKGEGRLIVAGNAAFLANESYIQLNNGDLFLNSLNWMADEKSLIAIPPKDNQPKTISLMNEQYTGIFFGTVVLMPLTLLGMALFVWWRRR
ncbi:MAG: GldG family protein [Candidatus Sericytochromatia bacterium]